VRFKRFKNNDFDKEHSVIKNALDAAMEENELRKDGKKSWKTMKNISINLYYIDFLYCKNIVTKNRQLLH